MITFTRWYFIGHIDPWFSDLGLQHYRPVAVACCRGFSVLTIENWSAPQRKLPSAKRSTQAYHVVGRQVVRSGRCGSAVTRFPTPMPSKPGLWICNFNMSTFATTCCCSLITPMDDHRGKKFVMNNPFSSRMPNRQPKNKTQCLCKLPPSNEQNMRPFVN